MSDEMRQHRILAICFLPWSSIAQVVDETGLSVIYLSCMRRALLLGSTFAYTLVKTTNKVRPCMSSLL
eukprot:226516-Pelagomonas_calceolata.AAC.1